MPANIGQLATLAIDNYSGVLADNISNHNPLLKSIFMKKNNKPANGGNTIRQELMIAENSTGKWYSGSELLDIADTQMLDAAQFDWKQYNTNFVINGLDKTKVKGESEQHSLIESKLKVTEITAKNAIAASIFSDGTGSGGKEIGGLQLVVADNPANTVGGINAATYPIWQNKTYDFSSESSGGLSASASNIQTGMNTAWLRVIRGTDSPDVIVADANFYSFYESSLQAIQRINKPSEGTLGFDSIAYKSANVFYDENCAANHMYMLNTDYLFFRYDPDRNFSRDKEKAPTNQDTVVIPLYWTGNLTCANRSLQCVLKN